LTALGLFAFALTTVPPAVIVGFVAVKSMATRFPIIMTPPIFSFALRLGDVEFQAPHHHKLGSI
jgi:hypothetical protein